MDKELDLYTYFTQLSGEARVPMHMPGHKRRNAVAPYMQFSAVHDFTEIDATDDLHDATGVLYESMRLAANLWGSRRAFYLVNGSTCGILAGIRALTKRGDKILVSRNAHRSVFHAIELCGLVPVFVLPPQVPGFGVCGSCPPDAVAAAFAAHPDIAAMVLTSPTYEGILSDVARISEIVHENGATLLVDEAHGAHLGLHPAFEKSAVQCGADVVVQSLHKTLSALTQTAILHVCSTRVDEKRLMHQLAVFETSSPSYPLMISADGCVRQAVEKKDAFDAWLVGLAGFSIWAGQLMHLKVLGHGNALPEGIFATDDSKLYISTHQANITGTELASALAAYKIDVEMATENGVLAMTGAGDSIESVGAFAEALLAIDASLALREKPTPAPLKVPEQVLLPEAALEAAYQLCALEDACGAVSAEYVWAYPPGIPVLIPGERITDAFAAQVIGMQADGICLRKSRSSENDKFAVIAS